MQFDFCLAWGIAQGLIQVLPLVDPLTFSPSRAYTGTLSQWVSMSRTRCTNTPSYLGFFTSVDGDSASASPLERVDGSPIIRGPSRYWELAGRNRLLYGRYFLSVRGSLEHRGSSIEGYVLCDYRLNSLANDTIILNLSLHRSVNIPVKIMLEPSPHRFEIIRSPKLLLSVHSAHLHLPPSLFSSLELGIQ